MSANLAIKIGSCYALRMKCVKNPKCKGIWASEVRLWRMRRDVVSWVKNDVVWELCKKVVLKDSPLEPPLK